MKGRITVTETSSRSRKKRPLAFKNNAPFISCVSKINNTLIDNAEDLNVVVPMSNLLEYSKIIQRQRVAYGIITEMNQLTTQTILIFQIKM